MPDAVSVKVSGLAEIEQKLLQLAPKLARRHLAKAVRAGSNILRDLAKGKVPVKTGALRDRITARVRPSKDGKKVVGTIGILYASPQGKSTLTTLFTGKGAFKKEKTGIHAAVAGDNTQQPGVYGMFLELGTEHAPAQPWLRPAFDEGGQLAIQEAVDELRDGLEDSVRK